MRPRHHLALLLLAVACQGCGPQGQVRLSGTDSFREGDLVLRCGNGMESRIVSESSRSDYSHIGLLHRDAQTGRWLVVHAVPGEAPRGEPELLKCEPIEDFFMPQRARRGAWMRIDCDDATAAAAARYALRKVDGQTVFDNDYLLSDSTRIYCCELVWRAYMTQGIDISSGNRHDVPLPFCRDGECIFPIDIEKGLSTLFVQPFEN